MARRPMRYGASWCAVCARNDPAGEALAQLRHRAAALARRGTGRTVRRLPSWFLRIECDRCGKVVMHNESHAAWRGRTLRSILARMRHDGCGGLAAKAELLTGIEAATSRPVRRIALMGG